jgi:hypothetical protein
MLWDAKQGKKTRGKKILQDFISSTPDRCAESLDELNRQPSALPHLQAAVASPASRRVVGTMFEIQGAWRAF